MTAIVSNVYKKSFGLTYLHQMFKKGLFKSSAAVIAGAKI